MTRVVKVLVALLLIPLMAGCWGKTPETEQERADRYKGSFGGHLTEIVVSYRGYDDLHCQAYMPTDHKGLLSCDFVRFYNDHPDLLSVG